MNPPGLRPYVFWFAWGFTSCVLTLACAMLIERAYHRSTVPSGAGISGSYPDLQAYDGSLTELSSFARVRPIVDPMIGLVRVHNAGPTVIALVDPNEVGPMDVGRSSYLTVQPGSDLQWPVLMGDHAAMVRVACLPVAE